MFSPVPITMKAWPETTQGGDNSALIWMDHVNDLTFGKGRNANVYGMIREYPDKTNLIRYTESDRKVTGKIYPQ